MSGAGGIGLSAGGAGLGGGVPMGGTAAAGALGAGGTAGAAGGGIPPGGAFSAGGTASVPGAGGTAGAPPECAAPAGPRPDVAWIDGTCGAAPAGATGFETAEFCVTLASDAQTVRSLRPKSEPGFDFAPSDRLQQRSGAGYMYLGDVNLRWRPGGTEAWQNSTTSSSSAQVTNIAPSGDRLAAAELSPALPGVPLTVTRSWVNAGGRLAMRLELRNDSEAPVEVGALGLPMIFNNVITERSLEDAHAACSFADPYIGRDAGYLQVTRLSGHPPALLVLPEAGTPFEAYNPIQNPFDPTRRNEPTSIFTDLTRRQQPFEGFHEWLVHSSAYAGDEWSGVEPWNPPTAMTLAPGDARTYGIEFVLAERIREIEATLEREQRPVAVGIPGYILPMDLEARLYVKSARTVSSVTVDPEGALEIAEDGITPNCWQAYRVRGRNWGRARVSVTYDDGSVQTIHYSVTKPAAEAVSDMGRFLMTRAWFDNPSDPFGRSPSVMTYDREEDAIVEQWHQAWVAGLGDDGGATWLAGIMKLLGQPEAEQVGKYEQFVDGPIWGGLQYSEGALAYGVKRTLFYYEPTNPPAGYGYDPGVAWTNPDGTRYWGAWNRAHTLEVPRSYNYPHVAALYWVMYRLARNYVGLVSNHPWDWYLDHAYRTSIAMTTIGDEYARFGLMDGSVFLAILEDLAGEGWTQQAGDLEGRMRARADVWRTQAYPFGSEMAWDSTGQEEVYAWTRHFGYADKARVCVDAILGYMPTLPHWGYNGCARRFWDFKYGGAKIERLERMLHHYGSSLNAIPVLTEYRDHPEDLHLLRIGYGGLMGSLSNIDPEGFPSMGFHSFADTMKWDPRSGDYGLNFFGHAFNTATYLVQHPEFGWQAFGGNVTLEGTTVRLTPLDAFRQRAYLAPIGLWLVLDSGKFREIDFDVDSGAVRIAFGPSESHTPSARLHVEQPAQPSGVGRYAVAGTYATEREATVVPLGANETWIDLSD